MVAEVISLDAARAARARRRLELECGAVTCPRCGCSTLLARPCGETGEWTTCPICQHPRASFEPTGFCEDPGSAAPRAKTAPRRK